MSLFDRIAGRYDEWYATPRGKFVDTVQKELVTDLAGVLPGDFILDIGCGTGNYSLEMARRGARVTGVDLSSGMLAEARNKADSLGLTVDWVQADCGNLPFDANTFDTVVTVTALEFMDDPRGVLLEAMRVLKPGGRLVAGVLTQDSAWGRLYRDEADKNIGSVFASARLFTESGLASLLPCCREVRPGLFVPPGPPELDAAEARSLEETNRKQYKNAEQASVKPGFVVARWDKPGTEGPTLACQLALYPLGTGEVSGVVKKSLQVLECYPVAYETGSMSTVVRGNTASVWTAVWALADRAMEFGVDTVVQATVSNRCGCK